MTTIRELATQLDTTDDVIQVFVDQLVDVDGETAIVASTEPIVNGSGRTVGTDTYLTADAVEAVKIALEASEAADSDRADLELVSNAVEAADEADRARDLAIADRDEAIRRALGRGVRAARIAEVAGMHVQRIYQIRDGRR